MKVFLNDPIASSAYERLRKHVGIIDNYDHPEELDAIIVRQQYCTADVIRKAVKCRLIQQHGVGLDRIDVKAAEECGIPVKNTPGSNAGSVAEFAIALLLNLARKVSVIDRMTREGQLKTFGMPETVGTMLGGKKLGLVGSGHIACETAGIAKYGFHMDVYCYDPFKDQEQIKKTGMIPVSDLKTLFKTCDAVSLHCLLTEDSYHMIDADILKESNPSLILINTARGGLIDEKALYNALVSGQIAAAGLDVMEEQPPCTDDPLLKLDNVLVTMHVAGSTSEAMENTGKAVVDNVFEVLGITE